MNDDERAVVRAAARRIARLVNNDVRIPPDKLRIVLGETTKLTLLTYDDPYAQATIDLIGPVTALAYAEGKHWAKAVIDQPDAVHEAFHGLYD